MRTLLIVNSSASSVTARGQVVIQSALRADHDVTLAETTRRGNATRLAQSAAARGVELVVVLGGDGTLNEAANGLAGTDTALAVLPGGSTNVFARSLGWPNDPIEATGALVHALDRGSVRPAGLGSVNGRYFLFHTGVGFDAEVVHQVERRAGLKRFAGHPLFVYAAFATWFRHYDKSRPRFRIELEGDVIESGYFALIQNTDPYTYLGNRPLRVSPEANLDNALSLLCLTRLSFPTLVSVAAAALGPGVPARRPSAAEHRCGLSGFRVVNDRPFPYQVDGDYLGETDSLDFRHHPEILRLVVP